MFSRSLIAGGDYSGLPTEQSASGYGAGSGGGQQAQEFYGAMLVETSLPASSGAAGQHRPPMTPVTWGGGITPWK
jgi:hypothetical protein